MEKKFSYSVAIRTLGTAGEKYKRLLDSIQKQTIQPEKIVVVLPKGYNCPEYQLGCEEFAFSDKGMISQRLFALEYITSEYILFCDDDIELSGEFVEKIATILQLKNYDCASGPLLSFFPPNNIKYFVASALGGACVMLRGRNHTYTRLLRTGGWSYNWSIDTQKHQIYEADSLAWTCFCISSDAIKSIHFEDEKWEEVTGYAAFDDQTFFTKLKVNGFRTCVVSDALYIHNDGKTSTKSLKLEPIYAYAFNSYVYWNRFWYDISDNITEKVWLRICISYKYFMGHLYDLVQYLTGRIDREIIKTKKRGLKDAKAFLKSDGYKNMPSPIITKEE